MRHDSFPPSSSSQHDGSSPLGRCGQEHGIPSPQLPVEGYCDWELRGEDCQPFSSPPTLHRRGLSHGKHDQEVRGSLLTTQSLPVERRSSPSAFD